MKDYLNQNEVIDMIMISELHKRLDHMLENWGNRGNLTKDELKFLKMSRTYAKKLEETIFNRMAERERQRVKKKGEQATFKFFDWNELSKLEGRVDKALQMVHLEAETFIGLIEQLLIANCVGCTKKWHKCELHDFYKEHSIPESTWRLKNCRYAYKVITKEDIENHKQGKKRRKKQ